MQLYYYIAFLRPSKEYNRRTGLVPEAKRTCSTNEMNICQMPNDLIYYVLCLAV